MTKKTALDDAATIKAKAEHLTHPQKARATKAREAIKARVNDIIAARPEELPLTRYNSILAGDAEFDAAAFTAAIQRRRERLEVQDELDELGRLATDLQQQSRHHLSTDSFEPAYDYLREQLALVLSAVADPGTVPASADEAIRTGRPEAWETAQKLVSQYETIRSAQKQIWQAEGQWSPRHMTRFSEAGLLADAIFVDAAWLERRRAVGRSTASRRRSTSEFFTAVPETGFGPIRAGNVFPEGSAPVAYLSFIATEAEPWVPTAEQALAREREWTNAITSALPPAPKDADTQMYDAGRSVGRLLGSN